MSTNVPAPPQGYELIAKYECPKGEIIFMGGDLRWIRFSPFELYPSHWSKTSGDHPEGPFFAIRRDPNAAVLM